MTVNGPSMGLVASSSLPAQAQLTVLCERLRSRSLRAFDESSALFEETSGFFFLHHGVVGCQQKTGREAPWQGHGGLVCCYFEVGRRTYNRSIHIQESRAQARIRDDCRLGTGFPQPNMPERASRS